MFRPKGPPPPTLWIPTNALPTSPAHGFYQQLDRVLAKVGFGDAVRQACAPFYTMDVSRGGRPAVDPEVYFKMLIVGFFEHLASERAIAARCADSFSIREFLHYGLDERTPDHSTLTVIRQRLGPAAYEQAFAAVLQALKQHKLLKGKRLGIDASILEANASLRSLQHRLTGEAYGEFVKQLAAAAGVDATDAAAVRRFDKKRKDRTTSNADWQNPHDPDAKVGRTKRGTTRMVYKPEHVTDLDTGAIVDVEVRPGDAHDSDDLTTRVLDAEARMNTALGDDPDTARVRLLATDKGYYAVKEVTALQDVGITTVMSDPIENRRVDRLPAAEQQAVRTARRTVRSTRGKALLRRRGEVVERSFAHVLDSGGARRTTLRGRDNIRKRYLIQAACANLSLLLRKLVGLGTPKQALAASAALVASILSSLRALVRLWVAPWICWRLAGPRFAS
jgi:transposase